MIAKRGKTAVNEITGNVLMSKFASQEYSDNYDRIFGPKQCSKCGEMIDKGKEVMQNGDFFHEGCCFSEPEAAGMSAEEFEVAMDKTMGMVKQREGCLVDAQHRWHHIATKDQNALVIETASYANRHKDLQSLFGELFPDQKRVVLSEEAYYHLLAIAPATALQDNVIYWHEKVFYYFKEE
jgi:hypothetical protein